VQAVRTALLAHGNTCTAAERPFHEELEKGYNELVLKMMPFVLQ
jgi:hypothetical protein